MAKNLFQKVWDAHAVRVLANGQTQLLIGTHLIHEVTSPQAFGMLRDLGMKVKYPERTFATVDHIVPTDQREQPFSDPLADEMIKVAKKLKSIDGSYKFYMPLSDRGHLGLINEPFEDLVKVSFNNSQEVLSKCQTGIITSGTATLEALLLRTPCVTLYKTNWLSYRIIKPLLSIENFSLPNLLSGNTLLPELLQDKVNTENIINSLNDINSKGLDYYYNEFHEIHENLKAGSSETAANEISNLID